MKEELNSKESKKEKKANLENYSGAVASAAAVGLAVAAAELWQGQETDDETLVIPEPIEGREVETATLAMAQSENHQEGEPKASNINVSISNNTEKKEEANIEKDDAPVSTTSEKSVEEDTSDLKIEAEVTLTESDVDLKVEFIDDPLTSAEFTGDEIEDIGGVTLSTERVTPHLAQKLVQPTPEEIEIEDEVFIGPETAHVAEDELVTVNELLAMNEGDTAEAEIESNPFSFEEIEPNIDGLDDIHQSIDDMTPHLAQKTVSPTSEDIDIEDFQIIEPDITIAAVDTENIDSIGTEDLLAANEIDATETNSEGFAIESTENDNDILYNTLSDLEENAPYLAQTPVEPTTEDIDLNDIPFVDPELTFGSATIESERATGFFAMNEVDPNDIESQTILEFDKVGTMIDENGREMATATYYDDGHHLMLVDTDGDQMFDHIASAEGKLHFAADYHLSVGDVATMVDGNDSYLANTDVDTSEFDFSNDLITT